MANWLLKSEPSSYSWDQLVSEGRTNWDGVRNAQALMRVGLTPEPRKFSPHVTLARLHKPALDKLSGFLAAHAQFRAAPYPVEGFSLIASFQTKAGSIYEDQADYPLLD